MKDRKNLKKKSTLVETNDIVLPGYTNLFNTLFGGKLMEMVDKTAGICAARYCHKEVVTASVEAVDFHIPIKVGYFVKLCAKVIFVGTSSMMIRVNVWGEEPLSGECKHCCTAYVNMVAIDKRGRPIAVPGLLIETEKEKKDYEEAIRIRESTLVRRKKHNIKNSG